MPSPYRISAASGIDPGDRPYQQDQVGLWPHVRSPGCVLGVVADGMGGLSGGRNAAEQIVLTARQLFEQFDPGRDPSAEFLQRMAHEAHLGIRLTAVVSEQEPHSTLAAFLLEPGGICHFIHSGDSRLYHFRGPQLLHRSRDHSLVQSLVDRGELNELQAHHDRRSNLLLHCLGTQKPPEISLHRCAAMQPGDALLACSDGIWSYFSDIELGQLLAQAPARQSCETVVQLARKRARGKGDNLSLIVLRLDPIAAKP